jgi:hypothetical protein
MSRLIGRFCYSIAISMVLVLAACGDPDTTDPRGYTKPPLEQAGLLIKGEGSSAMDSLGTPNLPRDTVFPAENIQPTTAQPKR